MLLENDDDFGSGVLFWFQVLGEVLSVLKFGEKKDKNGF
jgi:hypothetical protein